MNTHEILDRLERMHAKLTDGREPDDYRLYQMETMLDVLITHIRESIKRDTMTPNHRRPA